MDAPVTIEFNEDNSKKIRQLAGELNLSYTEVCNRYFAAVKTIEVKEIITFKVEVRSAEDPKAPGKKQLFQQRTNFVRDW
jgi:hypothetical protein